MRDLLVTCSFLLLYTVRQALIIKAIFLVSFMNQLLCLLASFRSGNLGFHIYESGLCRISQNNLLKCFLKKLFKCLNLFSFVEEKYVLWNRALFGFALQSLGETLHYCHTLIFTFFQALWLWELSIRDNENVPYYGSLKFIFAVLSVVVPFTINTPVLQF